MNDDLIYVEGVFVIDKNTYPETILAFNRKKRNPGFGFPCGCVEPGESPGQAAVRECFEETGYHVELNNVPPYVEQIDKLVISTYWANIVGERELPTHACEGDAEWLTPNSFLDQTVYPEYNKRCLQYFSPLVIEEIQMYFCPQCDSNVIELWDMAEICPSCQWTTWNDTGGNKQENYIPCTRCEGYCCMWQRTIPNDKFITERTYHISPEHHRCVCDPNKPPNC